VAQALGWFSVGLGLTALLAPRTLGNLTGIGPRAGLLRAVGLREMTSGVGLLSSRDATPWLWSRVAGDAIDLLALGAAAAQPQAGTRTRSLLSLALVAGVTAADVSASLRQTRRRGSRADGITEEYVERSIVINKSPQECYEYWRDVTNAPNYMRMIESATDLGDRRSHWVATMPGGVRVEWDSRVSEDLPGERIAWHSTPDSPLLHAGVVSFERAPGERGTVVRLMVHYRPPAGLLGRIADKALGQPPAFELKEDLRRFKQILETQEIATTRGQTSGRRSLFARVVRAGRDS
jgi:uncharacterized membrane protein